jgi:hypothetical protein
MRMNADKCAFMYVTLSNLRRFGLYNINGNPIPHADYIKLLDVFVAFDLSWNYRVEALRSKCRKLLGFVNRNLMAVFRETYVKHTKPLLDLLCIMESQVGSLLQKTILLSYKEFKIKLSNNLWKKMQAMNLTLTLCRYHYLMFLNLLYF